MPWHVEADSPACPANRSWAVIKDDDGSLAGCHPSRTAAERQIAALHAAEADGEASPLAAPPTFTPPDDRADIQGWLETRADAFARRARRVYANAVAKALTLYADTLTASADPDYFAAYDHIDFVPPQGARDEAERGLAWNADGKGGAGLEPATIQRARSMAAGEPRSPETVRRMKAYFDRHDGDRAAEGWRPDEAGYPTPGRVAWALWGGDPGRTWANKVVGQMARADDAAALLAAGDPAAMDGLGLEMLGWIQGEAGAYLHGMHLAGSMSAWMASPLVGKAPATFAGKWAAVVNDNALTYQATATNRIVGASQALWTDVRDETVRALQAGMTNEQLKDAIQDITGYTEFRADTIARTETMAAYAGGDYTGARALGEYGPTEKAWLAALDARTRETHAEADGQTVLLNEPFDVGGVPMQHPLDAGAPAEEVVNCRCVLLTLYPGDERPDGSIVETPDGA